MYAVEIEIEKGEYTLVRAENPWTYDCEVMTFRSLADAETEAARWNTGKVVPYIRPMTDEERQRSVSKNAT